MMTNTNPTLSLDRARVKQNGFTLIEMVVVAGILGLLTVGMVQILLNSFKAKSKVGLSNKVDTGATYILGEIRKGLINADGRSINCSSPTQITYQDMVGIGSTIVCDSAGSYIALSSATGTVHLSEDGVIAVSGCGNFISCNISPVSGFVSKVNIGFTLTSGTAGAGVGETFQRSFQSSVTIRN